MSQSLHAIPTPHFDGHLNAKPFAEQQEKGGLNLHRKKSAAPVAESDQKGDVKADFDSHINQHQLQEKGQGFETKKSLAAPEGDAEDGTDDVKRLKDDFTNNKNQAASDDIKPVDARALQEIRVINERRISQGRTPITNEAYYRDMNHLEHCPTCRSFCMPAPRTTGHDLLATLFRHPQKPEKDPSKNSIPLNRRFRALPEPPPPIDPQKAWDNFYKIRSYRKRSA